MTKKKPEELELLQQGDRNVAFIAADRPRENKLQSFLETDSAFNLKKCARYERALLEPHERIQCTRNYQETDCVCGRPISVHPPDSFSEDASKKQRWLEKPCDSYGEMRFIDPKRKAEVEGSTARYIRLSGKTDDSYMEKVCELLMGLDYWAMDPPQLLIEVTGTAAEFTGVNERLTEKLYEGLIKTAEAGDAWLVTGGSNSGIMKLVGDAAAKARRLNISLTCLGIASWGIISNRDALEKTPQQTGDRPVDYLVESRGGISLNYGHNYYLLVDNGIEERYGEEIAFRASLMNYISKRAQVYEERVEAYARSHSRLEPSISIPPKSPKLSDSSRWKHRLVSIPRVLLVVGGGPNTLRTVKIAISGTAEHPTAVNPVVCLAGFGGAGDLIAHAYQYLQNKAKNAKHQETPEAEKEQAPRDFFLEISKNSNFPAIAGILPGSDSLDEEQRKWDVVNDLYKCLQKRRFFTVVDLRNPREMTLDKAILNAIFKAELFKDEACYRMLDLARRWDLANVAKDIIERYYVNMKKMDQSLMDDLLSLSIVCGQSDFYELFTDYKLVYLDKFLHQEKIEELYMTLISKMDVNEEEVRQPKKHQLLRCVQLFATMLASNCGSTSQCEVSLRNIGDMLADMLGCYLSNPFAIQSKSEAARALASSKVYIWASRDLFLMQLILLQDRFAMNLWRDGRDHIGTALLASIFLHELSQKARRNDMVNLVERYQQLSEVWLTRAIQVLTICNESRPEAVHDLLTRALPSWQNRTVLEIAFYGKRRRFTEQPAVISKLAHVWYGRVASFTSQLLIYLTALLPVLIFGLKFEVEKQTSSTKKKSTSMEFRSGCGKDVRIREISTVNLYGKRTVLVTPSLKCRCCGVCCHLDHDRVSFPRALFYLYTSPMIKFLFHSGAMLAFLLLFTSFILNTSLHPEGATRAEFVILVWSLCLLCDAIHESIGLDLMVFMEQNSSDYRAFLKETLRRLMHGCYSALLFDVMAETVLVTSFVLRHTLTLEYFVYPQTLYALACLFFWIKSFRVFYLSKSIGILVVTLGKILPILLQFLLLYIVLIVTFAPPLFALANPHSTKSSLEEDPQFFPLLLDVIYKRWWNLVGVAIDITRSRIEETCPMSYVGKTLPNATSPWVFSEVVPGGSMDEPTIQRCESGGSILGRNFVAAILFVTYLWLTNITWLNMLIASLNRSVEATRASAIEFWSFNYYIAVRTWYHRCVTPAPFSFIELLLRFAFYLTSKGRERNTQMRKYTKAAENLRIDELERSAVDQMLDEEERKR